MLSVLEYHVLVNICTFKAAFKQSTPNILTAECSEMASVNVKSQCISVVVSIYGGCDLVTQLPQ